jgi:hypothetical protein
LRKYFIIGVADFNKERPTFVLQVTAIANQASEKYWYFPLCWWLLFSFSFLH